MADPEVSDIGTNPFLRRDKVRRNSGIKVDRNFVIPSDDMSSDEDGPPAPPPAEPAPPPPPAEAVTPKTEPVEAATPSTEEPQTTTSDDGVKDAKVAEMEAKMKAMEDAALAKRKLVRDKASDAVTGALAEKKKAEAYAEGVKDAQAKSEAEMEVKIKAAAQEAYQQGQKDAAEKAAADKAVADKIAAEEAAKKKAQEEEDEKAAAETAPGKKKSPGPDVIVNATDGPVEGRLTEAILRKICGSDLAEMKQWLLDPSTHIEDTEPAKKHTALLWCSRIGSLESLQYLIDAGADTNATMIAGGTAIYVATQEDHLDCLELLIASGGDVNAKLDSTGGSALDIASMMARVECLKILVAAGADVNAIAIDGTSALYSAEQSGCPECVEILKDAGSVETKEMKQAADIAYELALKEAREELMEEAAERITRFIRYAGFVVKHGGGNAAKMAAMAMGGKTEKKKRTRRRKSITKKAKDMRASVYSGEVAREGYLEKKSSRGKYQSRYFEISSHYLKYYQDSTKTGIKAACDLDDLNVCVTEKEAKFYVLKLVIGTESLVLRTAGVGDDDKAWVDSLNGMADLAKKKSAGGGDGEVTNVAVTINDDEEAAEEEEEVRTAAELKAELVRYYEKEAPEKVEEISDDLCDYFKDKRGELSKGLMSKYGVDLHGNEALWRPTEDEVLSEQRKNIASRRITRFVRFCILQQNGGAGLSVVNKAFGLENDTKKTKSKQRRRQSITKSKAKFRQSVYQQEELVEGYLEKMSSGLRKKWMTRYFAVGGHYLKYFKDQMKTDVRAVIDLNFLSKMSIPSESCMDIVVNGALIQLRCPNAGEFKQWQKCLQGFLDTNRAAAQQGAREDKSV
jgi:hypothetical protein